MKRFFFRLETLLRLRKAHEGSLQRELAYQEQKGAELKEKKELLEKQIASLSLEIVQKKQKKELSLHETYTQILEHLNLSLSQIMQTLIGHEKQIEEQKERLKTAIQGRKIIEKIKEKHYGQWRSQLEASEGALFDEVSKRS